MRKVKAINIYKQIIVDNVISLLQLENNLGIK